MSTITVITRLTTCLIAFAAVLTGAPVAAQPDNYSFLIVSTGGHNSCAIKTGTLYCWGADENGQVGNGPGNYEPEPTFGVSSPQKITAATDWKSVSVGYTNTCAIRSIGKLYCWGQDYYGEQGNGSLVTANQESPQAITRATDWKSVSAGEFHTCAIRSTGKLYCWGKNDSGRWATARAGLPSPVPSR